MTLSQISHKYSLAHPFFLSVCLPASLSYSLLKALRRVENSEWRELWIARVILSPKLGPSLRGSFLYGGVPPIPILFPVGYMVSEQDFDWLLIFVYKGDVWVWIVTLSCPRTIVLSVMSLRRSRGLRGPKESKLNQFCFIIMSRIYWCGPFE